MRILLFGATGRTGRLVLEYALSKGHEVVALVRDPGKIMVDSRALTLIKGTPERAEDVAKAIAGCEAVVVALNNNRTSDMPWAKPVSPPHLIEHSVKNGVTAMKANGIRRIMIQSATGVGDSFPYAPWMIRFLVRRTNLAQTYADHDGVDAYIRTTADIDWTLVRAVGLSSGDKVKGLVVSNANQPKPAMMISRKHVAQFMIDGLGDKSLFGKAPVISER